jgi:hypothetical protein
MPMQRSFTLLLTLAMALGLLVPLVAPTSTRAAPTELFFSEYVEGSGNNRALEIFNGTGAPIDLAAGGYQVRIYFNAADVPATTIDLTGVIASADVFVLADDDASSTILAAADLTSPATFFDGDDAVELARAGIAVDVIGDIGADPGDFWGIEPVTTRDHTLRRKATITQGDPIGTDDFVPSIEWDGFAENTFNGLGSHTLAVTATQISQIQSAGHLSSYDGLQVFDVEGIVTATRTGSSGGFWMSDPTPDADPATSDGIFVFRPNSAADPLPVAVGDLASVDGIVDEFRSGGSGGFENLTTTEIVTPTITTLSTGNMLPFTLIGAGGRLPPATVIDDDTLPSGGGGDGTIDGVGAVTSFDPTSDGIDFWESLEGMRLQVTEAIAVGPTAFFGAVSREIAVVSGAAPGVRTPRAGILVRGLGPAGDYRPGDFNPERLILANTLAGLPEVNVGDGFETDPVGVLDYSFGNFKLFVTANPGRVNHGLLREVTDETGSRELAVATYNVENLTVGNAQAKFDELAGQIVHNLRSPDLIGIEEMQDDSGATNDGIVTAQLGWERLVAAIVTAGGPVYEFRSIDPVNNADGGAPGSNIRVGFL